MAGWTNQQDETALLTAQNKEKQKPKKFVYASKKSKGDGFLAPGFKTSNPG